MEKAAEGVAEQKEFKYTRKQILEYGQEVYDQMVNEQKENLDREF